MTNFSSKSNLFYLCHVLIDSLIVFISIYMIYSSIDKQAIVNELVKYAILFSSVTFMTVSLFNIFGTFRCGRRTYFEVLMSILLSLFIRNLVLFIIGRFSSIINIDYENVVIAFFFEVTIFALWKHIVFELHPVFYKKKSVVIFGGGNNAQIIAKKVLLKNQNIFDVKYIIKDINDRKEILKKINDMDIVFIASGLELNKKSELINIAIRRGKKVYIIPDVMDITVCNAKIGRFDDILALHVENFYLTLEKYWFKRCFDIVISIIMIIVTFPIMIITYIAIKLCTGGSSIFLQERITLYGKKFNIYKFRTMTIDGEKYTGPVLASESDDRITPIGGFLRATRIDELPQLFNVLFGDMSIVGPRPEREFFIEQFRDTLPDFELRLTVKAGLTGMAQVLGKYATAPEDKLKFDLFYVRNYSILLDLKIILQTVKIIFMRMSSQGVKDYYTRRMKNEQKS